MYYIMYYCREKIHHWICTNKFQIGVICLVILDCLLVISELLIDLQVFAVARSQVPASKVSEVSHSFFSTSCNNIFVQVLHFISIGILSLFLVEIALKVYAMRLDFFKKKMEVI